MKMNHIVKLVIFSFTLVLSQTIYSTGSKNNFEFKVSFLEEKIDYAIWEKLLSENVDDYGNVNYKGFITNKEKFETFLDQLCATTITNDWSKSDKIAYWINVYNAFTIKLIVDNYPTKSIKDISSPWKQKFFTINGEEMNLSEVEHDILRKKFNEPRIHFAINCASASCPPVLNKPYLASNLETLLVQQTKNFINNSKYNKIANTKIQLSKIFDWYKKDFENNGNDLIDYINKYSDVKIDNSAKKSYLTYDWSLNSKS